MNRNVQSYKCSRSLLLEFFCVLTRKEEGRPLPRCDLMHLFFITAASHISIIESLSFLAHERPNFESWLQMLSCAPISDPILKVTDVMIDSLVCNVHKFQVAAKAVGLIWKHIKTTNQEFICNRSVVSIFITDQFYDRLRCDVNCRTRCWIHLSTICIGYHLQQFLAQNRGLSFVVCWVWHIV